MPGHVDTAGDSIEFRAEAFGSVAKPLQEIGTHAIASCPGQAWGRGEPLG
jgi:hypothetical protein